MLLMTVMVLGSGRRSVPDEEDDDGSDDVEQSYTFKQSKLDEIESIEFDGDDDDDRDVQ